jgi:hypothetical protein
VVFSSLRRIILLVYSIIRVYYFQFSPTKRLKYGAYRLLLSSSFLIIIYCFLAYILTDDISILSNGAQVIHLKIHILQFTNPPRHLRAQSSFRRFFFHRLYHPFEESIEKRLMPTCIRFCSSLPSVSFAPGLLSFPFYYSARFFFCP